MEINQDQEKVTQMSSEVPSSTPSFDEKRDAARLLINDIVEQKSKDFVHTFKDARVTQNLEKMKLFEVRMVLNQKYILIPSNLADLANSNYLFALFAKALKVMEKSYNPIIGGGYKDNMPVTKESELFLNGFGCSLVNANVIPYTADLKGKFRKGYYCMLKYITATYKKLDPRIMRFGDSHHAVQELFGEAWATTRLNEKVILDIILTATKEVCQDWLWINSYVLPKEELIKKFGLKTNKHVTKVLSDIEQDGISYDYDGYFKTIEKFEVPKFKEKDDYVQFQNTLNALSKEGKRYKTLVKNIVDQRMKVLYTGNKQEKAKKAKIPVKELITKVRGTRDFVNSFQPNEALKVPKFVLASYPSDDEGVRALGIQLSQWAVTISSKADKARVETCRNWILSESSL
jgi:Fe-S-cluster formation regulator IscX/YfhJ